MANISEERIKQLYDPNFFYEYGMNPNMKQLIQIMQENTEIGAKPTMRTTVKGQPKRWFPFRDFDDFLVKELRVYNFMRSLPIFFASSVFFVYSIVQAKLLLPVGKYGYTKISHTPFYRAWGNLGVAGALAYPAVMGYFWYKTFLFTGKKFYHHVVLQERNWLVEYFKFTPPHGDYAFKDTPISSQMLIPADAVALMNQKVVPPPKWFQ